MAVPLDVLACLATAGPDRNSCRTCELRSGAAVTEGAKLCPGPVAPGGSVPRHQESNRSPLGGMMLSAIAATGAFFAGAVVTFALTPLVAKFAARHGIVDRPDARKVHKGPTPRMGGLAVFAGLVAGSSVYGFSNGWGSHSGLLSGEAHLCVLVPCLIVFAIGLIDDCRGVPPVARIVVEGVAAVLLMGSGFLIDVVWSPVGPPVELGLLAYPVTLLWLIGVTNAFNLTDGLDGLLSSVGMVSLAGCAAVGLSAGMVGTPALALALVGALAGFLPWNWHRARIFLGDSGSLLLGFVAAALSIEVSRDSEGSIALHVLLLLCAVPVIETSITLVRRYVSNKPFFSPDRGHVHHVLVDKKGLAIPRAVIALVGAQALFSGMAVFSATGPGWYALIPNAVLLVTIAVCIQWLGYVELDVIGRHLLDGLLYRRRRHLSALAEMARGGRLVGTAESAAELKDHLREATVRGGFAYLALEFSKLGEQLLRTEPSVIECHNDEAEAYLRSRNGDPFWLLSAEEARASEDKGKTSPGGVTFAVGLPVSDGRYGRLVCHRREHLRAPAPAARDVRQYLAEPLAKAMERLGRSLEDRTPKQAIAGELWHA